MPVLLVALLVIGPGLLPATADKPDATIDTVDTVSAGAGANPPATQPATTDNPLVGLAGNGAPAEAGRTLSAVEKQILGPGHWASTPKGKTWYGAYLSLTGYNAYCVDAGLRTPHRKYFTKPATRQITTPQTAYLLATHSGAKSANDHAALSAAAKLGSRIPHRHQVPVKAPSKLGKSFAGTAKRYKALTAEARRFAGPYKLTVTLGKPVRGDKGTTTVAVSVMLRAASGAAVPGYSIALSGSAGTLSRTTLTSGTAPTKTTLTVPTPKPTDRDTVTVNATASGLPSTKVVLYKPSGKGSARVQNVVTKGRPLQAKTAARVAVQGPTQPRVTTEISEQKLTPGVRVWDTFTVTGLGKNQRVDVEHTLWHIGTPPSQSAKQPAGARKLATTVSKAVGNGTGKSPVVTLPKQVQGWVYWTERIAPTRDIAGWQSDHGIAKETGLVPWKPTVATKASIDSPRAQASDRITVAGGRPGSQVHLTARLFHAAEQPHRQKTPDGEKIAEQSLTITLDDSGAGSVKTKAVSIKQGWASWVVTLRAGQGWDAWTSDYGVPEETVHLPIPTIPAVPPATPSRVVVPSTPPATPAESTPPAPPSTNAPATTTPPQTETPPASVPPAPTGPTEASAAPEAPAPEAGGPVADEQAQQPAGGQLPRTGSQASLIAGFGLLLVGLGIVATVVTRGQGRKPRVPGCR